MGLTEVASYQRTVRASLASVWDNVLDWAHLPWLHRATFRAIAVHEAGPRGWRATVDLQPGRPNDRIVLELRTEHAAGRYVARTLEGTGAGTEIWTTLTAAGDAATAIDVRFHVPDVAPARVERIGATYTRTYHRLWDEDEAMMMRRETLLAGSALERADATASVALGRLESLRSRLPLVVELDGRDYRVVEIAGELVAHGTICPHMLGPLADAAVDDGCIRCPWHGYRFDVRTGRGIDDRHLRLAPAPRLEIDPATTEVRLTFA